MEFDLLEFDLLTLLLLLRNHEQSAEEDDLHVDQDAQTLMPEGGGATDLNESCNQRGVFTRAMRNIRNMTEDMVCKALKFLILFDVHHVEQCRQKKVGKKGKELGAFLRRQRSVEPEKDSL